MPACAGSVLPGRRHSAMRRSQVTSWRSPSEPQWRFASSGVRWSTSIPPSPTQRTSSTSCGRAPWPGISRAARRCPCSARSGIAGGVERAASLSAADMAHALQQRNTYYTGMRQFMDLQRFDLLLTPTLPVHRVYGGAGRTGWLAALDPCAARLDPVHLSFQSDRPTGGDRPLRLRSERAARRLAARRALARRRHGPSRRGRV